MKKIIIIVTIGFLLSCMKVPNSTVVPPNKMLVLSCVLQNYSKYQKLELYRAFAIYEIDSINMITHPDTLSSIFGITGADVKLITPDSIYQFNERLDRKGEYLLHNFSPESDLKYIIQIRKKGFKSLEGWTQYPRKLPFYIKYKFTKKGDLLISWNKITGAKGYRIDLYRWERIRGHFGYYYQWGLLRWFLETKSEIIISSKYLHFKNGTKRIKIMIWAIDKNYYQFFNFQNYYDPHGFHLIDYGNFSTVKNGLGYFGSAYVDSLIIDLNNL